jgi:hypothetical protein
MQLESEQGARGLTLSLPGDKATKQPKVVRDYRRCVKPDKVWVKYFIYRCSAVILTF